MLCNYSMSLVVNVAAAFSHQLECSLCDEILHCITIKRNVSWVYAGWSRWNRTCLFVLKWYVTSPIRWRDQGTLCGIYSCVIYVPYYFVHSYTICSQPLPKVTLSDCAAYGFCYVSVLSLHLEALIDTICLLGSLVQTCPVVTNQITGCVEATSSTSNISHVLVHRTIPSLLMQVLGALRQDTANHLLLAVPETPTSWWWTVGEYNSG